MPRADFSGKKNPFYGKRHTPETIERIRQHRRGKCLGNKNALGHKHTESARHRIQAAMKKAWQQERPFRLSLLPHFPQRASGFRGRIRDEEWTRTQQLKWRAKSCEWCGSRKNLELDHIIPRFAGGKRIRQNAQTLCAKCNRWKHDHIDAPMWRSLQAAQGTH